MSDDLRQRLLRGEMVVVGNKIYALCGNCGSIVCVNKRFFGSMHICAKGEAEKI